MIVRKIGSYLLVLIITAMTICSCTRAPSPDDKIDQTQVSDSVQETVPDSSGGDSVAKKVQADFDTLTNEIFKEELSADPLSVHLMLRYPENYGITVTNPVFSDFSEATLKQSTAEIKEMLTRLQAIDSSLLTPEQLFTYQMLKDYLDTELSGDGLELYTQKITPAIGTQAQLPILFGEYAFFDKTDVENYLSLLSSIDVFYKQLADFEVQRANAGLGMSDTTLDRVILSCKDYMIRPESSFLTETFDSKLEEVPDLTEEEKAAYKSRHLSVLKEHFIPAYTQLAAALEGLKGKGTNSMGLSYFPDGKRYYEYLVKNQSGTASSMPDLKTRVEKQLGQYVAEITLLSENNPDLYTAASTYSFSQTEANQILEHLREESKEDFPVLEDSAFVIKHVPKALESTLSPAFFLTPPLDYMEEGIIYLNGAAEQASSDLYSTLAHEGYPGHLYQSLYGLQKKSSPLRSLLSCKGYAEGWGSYAELYSYGFNNGLSKELQELLTYNNASVLAIYALLDIHIHYDGWDLAKTSAFLQEYYDIQDSAVLKEIYDSIIDNPGNYLTYYTGYLEIMEMREIAEDTLKDRFNIKEFHKFILEMDGASFRIIKPYFNTWLLTYEPEN